MLTVDWANNSLDIELSSTNISHMVVQVWDEARYGQDEEIGCGGDLPCLIPIYSLVIDSFPNPVILDAEQPDISSWPDRVRTVEITYKSDSEGEIRQQEVCTQIFQRTVTDVEPVSSPAQSLLEQ